METYTSGRESREALPLPVMVHEPSRELTTGNTRVRLQKQPFQVLQLLLARAGEVVTREELRDRLWPQGTFVDYEHSLNAAVKRLRAVLGDDAKSPRYIETLPRLGYRWIAATIPIGEPRVMRPASGPIQIIWS